MENPIPSIEAMVAKQNAQAEADKKVAREVALAEAQTREPSQEVRESLAEIAQLGHDHEWQEAIDAAKAKAESEEKEIDVDLSDLDKAA